MSLDLETQIDLKLKNAVQYLLKEHGDNALREAQSALRYAEQINDRRTVDLFSEIIIQLSKLHRE